MVERRNNSLVAPESAEATLPLKHPSAEIASVSQIDPIVDPRWTEFLNRHPRSSVFHSTAWLAALRRTYGYVPTVLTTANTNEKLSDALVFCEVDSWLTGRRLVSVPFADHCDLLLDEPTKLLRFTQFVRESNRGNWKYVEIRPLDAIWTSSTPSNGFTESRRYHHHELDVRPSLEQLYQSFHKDCVQRKIRRAEREALTYEEGRSDPLLEKFYSLLILTRRRHRIPPQPRSWFCNLIQSFGDSLNICVASKERHAIAAILTLRHKNTLVYKYGCSDARLNKLGGMHLLLWRAIQHAKVLGLETLDMGRTDWNDSGLLDFKDRWGAMRSPLIYARTIPDNNPRETKTERVSERVAAWIFGSIPSSLAPIAGRILYKHFG